jgi:hypothetical protein
MPRFTRCGCVTVFALFAVLVPSLLHADALPPAIATQIFSYGGVVYNGPPGTPYSTDVSNSLTYSSPFGSGNAELDALTHGTSDPGVMSRVFVSGAFGGSSVKQFDSRSTINYYFEVNGPANQSVTIDLASSGFANVQANSFGAEAILSIFPASDPANGIFASAACAGDTSHLANPLCANTVNAPSGFNVNTALNIQTDTAYHVILWAETNFSAPNSNPIVGVQRAIAAVDPSIALATSDPSYSLSFSAGLTPDASPVPEPGTLVLILPGIAGLAFFVSDSATRRCTLRPSERSTHASANDGRAAAGRLANQSPPLLSGSSRRRRS